MTFIAFCENPGCGAIFQASGIIGGAGSATVHIVNSQFGPCPTCGGVGRIPDGVYQYANNVVSFLSGPETTVQILREVQDILRAARTNNSSTADIERDVASVSSTVAQAIKGAPKSENVVQWLSLLIAIIGLAIQIHSTYFKSDDLEAKLLEHILQENKYLLDQTTKALPYKRSEPKIPRNAPCPCGSGKKFTKCCGTTAT